MSSNNLGKGKLIFKNTIYLYLRMFVMMAVSLYTSRIVLRALGIEDFGIYNVVGGIVLCIGFLNNTMSTASSRFITVAIAHNENHTIKNVFSNVFTVNIMLAFLVVLVSETVGLWFFYEKMKIPENRIDAAFWTYQISIISTVMNIITVPYNASIIAYEKMQAFAYITLFDAFAKLIIACLLLYTNNIDLLVSYSLLILFIQFVDCYVYREYCKRKFDICKVSLKFDKEFVKEMFAFVGWSSYGSFVSLGFTQGLNILLNVFFGPIVNASRGIAVQVQNSVQNFMLNFQLAVNPQLIKSFSINDLEYTKMLVEFSSKISFFLLCMLSMPIVANTNYILDLWLGQVPDFSVEFIQVTLCISIWQSLATCLRVVNQAEGNIRKFQMYECTWLLFIVPISFLVLKLGMGPTSVFFVYLFFEFSANFIRIFIVLPKIQMACLEYCKKIYLRIMPLFVITCALALYFHGKDIQSFSFLCLNSLILESIIIVYIYCFGLSKTEKGYLKKITYGIKSKFVK